MQTATLHETAEIRQLIGALQELHSEMLSLVRESGSELSEIHPDNRPSAMNLIHYLALRRHDIRRLQERLAALGLSSLGRTETHVLSTLRAVMDVLSRLDGGEAAAPEFTPTLCQRAEGRGLLDRNTETLLGPVPSDRTVRTW